MSAGLTHTICLRCRRRLGAAYERASWHARLTREGRLRCRFCGALLALIDDTDEEDAA